MSEVADSLRALAQAVRDTGATKEPNTADSIFLNMESAFAALRTIAEGLETIADQISAERVSHDAPPDPCPQGPHRGPEGPCEDIACCPVCYMPTFTLRPPGECFGHHAPDCSLPERHESFCKGGGAGHPTGTLRGWPEFTWEAR